MAYLLPHLHSGWEVDQAIVTEEDRVVVIRFGRDNDATCQIQDEVSFAAYSYVVVLSSYLYK